MKIPYQLVSMITILRDYLPYEYQEYRDDEHEKLSDIADSLYADTATPDQFKGEYQTLYKKYGPDYFAKVLEDMSAIDSQLTTDEKVDELYADYEDRLKSSMSINSTSRVLATEDNSYANHLIKISGKDAKYALSNLNKSHKTLGQYGEPGDAGYYVSEFEEATPGYMWASNKGLDILDRNGISYEQIKKSIENSIRTKKRPIKSSRRVMASANYDTKLIAKWLKAKFDDEAFGTAYTMHRISDADAYMGRNKLTYNRKNNTIDLWESGDAGEDVPVYKVIPQYSSTKKQGTYAPKLPKLVPIDEWNATHNIESSKKIRSTKSVRASDNPFYDKLSDRDKKFVRDTEKKMATEFSPDNFDVYNALLPYIGEYSSNTGWSGSCDLMKVKDSTSVDGYIYKVIWDNSSTEIDLFSWRINDNPRIAGDYTLMVMPAHGMPDFCDSENDFYRAIRKIFGNGLRKIN